MIRPEDIASLTDFKRKTGDHLKRLRKTGRPQVLTINGKAAAVVLDAAVYERMTGSSEREHALEGIRRGLESFERGEGLPARQAFEALFRAIKAARRPRKRRGRAA